MTTVYLSLHEKCPDTEFFLVRISPHSDWYFVFLRIQSKCGKIRTRKNSAFGHFSRCLSLASPWWLPVWGLGELSSISPSKEKESLGALLDSANILFSSNLPNISSKPTKRNIFRVRHEKNVQTWRKVKLLVQCKQRYQNSAPEKCSCLLTVTLNKYLPFGGINNVTYSPDTTKS